jgi:chromosome segregation ATPase
MEIMQETGVDSLASLEERITRAVHLITELRSENAGLSKRVATLDEHLESAGTAQQDLESVNAVLRSDCDTLTQKNKQLSGELDELRGERKEVRTRIEKLLSQLDLLSAS